MLSRELVLFSQAPLYFRCPLTGDDSDTLQSSICKWPDHNRLWRVTIFWNDQEVPHLIYQHRRPDERIDLNRKISRKEDFVAEIHFHWAAGFRWEGGRLWIDLFCVSFETTLPFVLLPHTFLQGLQQKDPHYLTRKQRWREDLLIMISIGRYNQGTQNRQTCLEYFGVRANEFTPPKCSHRKTAYFCSWVHYMERLQ